MWVNTFYLILLVLCEYVSKIEELKCWVCAQPRLSRGAIFLLGQPQSLDAIWRISYSGYYILVRGNA